jgi:(1->4)-alpha-D-glucan 1-alpha-D-glucosylmutase
MLERWEDGQVKLYLTAAGLRLRQRQPRLFLEGDYLPLEARDERANHVIAFARRDGDDWGLVIAPRLFHSLTAPERPLPLGHRSWGDTHLVVPEALAHRRIRNLFTGEVLDTGVGTIAIADALRTCPVALLIPAR